MVKKSKNSSKSQEDDAIKPPFVKHLIKNGEDIANSRGNPLLAMYYCDVNGSIFKPDIEGLFTLLASRLKNKVEKLDVLLHTRGGDPNTSYLLIQTIRKFTKRVNFLIPQHAYSGGTLMCLGADEIFMGPYASLGPIDLQMFGGKLPVLSIDKYIEFVKHAKETITGCDPGCPKFESTIADALLLQLTNEIPPTKIGELFRLRKLSEYYAKILLSDYMFKYDDYRKKRVDRIVKRLNSEYPDHSFDIDYCIAKGLGLRVNLMEGELFFSTDKFINFCEMSKIGGEICPFLPRDKCEESDQDFRTPFFEVFLPKKEGDEK